MKTLRQIFIEMMSLNSVDNELAAELYFHAFLGAYFKHTITFGIYNKDLRISIVWIQPSRTGKGQMNKAFKRVCDECNVSCVITTEFTTAGLIGSIDAENIKYNSTYGLTPENPVVIGTRGKQYEYRNPVIKGDLGNFDVTIIDEAKNLLQQTRYTETLLTSIQPALDCPGHIRKKLSTKTAIEYDASPTIIATTYYYSKISDIIAEQGFFQRVALYIRDMNKDDMKRMRKKQKDIIAEEAKEKFESLLKEFKERLSEYKREGLKLEVEKKALDKLEELINKFIDKIAANLIGKELQITLTFSNTCYELALKIAAQYAIINKQTTITSANIMQSFKIIRSYIITIIEKLEIKDEQLEKHTQLLKSLSYEFRRLKVNKLLKGDVVKLICLRFNIGVKKSTQWVNDLINYGYLKIEKGKGREKYIIIG